MRKAKVVLFTALLVGTICVSGCSNVGSSNNTSQTVSTESSVTESRVVESSVVESSVTESSVVSEESILFTEDVAIEKLKTAILSKYPDAVFGEVEIILPIEDSYNGNACKLGIKGHATITDSYGHSVNKDFNYCADVLIVEKGIYVNSSTKNIGKFYGGRESLPEECEGYY